MGSVVSSLIGYPVLSLAFHTPPKTTPRISLLSAAPLFGLLYYLVHHAVKEPITHLGRKIILRTQGVAFANDPINAYRAPNFERRMSSFLIHIGEIVYLVWVLGVEPWFQNPNALAAIGPFELSHMRYSFGIVIYMNWILGTYLVKSYEEIHEYFAGSSVSRDTISNIFHHILTICMVVVSYFGKTCPFGISGAFCFLISDVSVHLCRGFNDVKLKTLAAIFLIPMVIGFSVSRCFLYPYYVIGNGIVGYFGFAGCGMYFRQTFGLAIIILSITMYVYNVYWTYYVIKVVYDAFSQGMGAKLDPAADRDVRKGDDKV